MIRSPGRNRILGRDPGAVIKPSRTKGRLHPCLILPYEKFVGADPQRQLARIETLMQANEGMQWIAGFSGLSGTVYATLPRTMRILRYPLYSILESAETFAQPLTKLGQPLSAKEDESNEGDDHQMGWRE